VASPHLIKIINTMCYELQKTNGFEIALRYFPVMEIPGAGGTRKQIYSVIEVYDIFWKYS